MKSMKKGLAILLAVLLVAPESPVSVERMMVAEAAAVDVGAETAEAGAGAESAADVSAAEPESAEAADDGSLMGEEPVGGAAGAEDDAASPGTAEDESGNESLAENGEAADGADSPESLDDVAGEALVDSPEEDAEPEDSNVVQGDGENMQPEDGLSVAYAENIVASGVSGNLTWTLDADGLLTISGMGNYNSSSDYLTWRDYSASIISAKVEVTGITNASSMFSGCGNLTSVDLSGFDTSNVKGMSGMFEGCSSLTSVDLSGFDTSNVIYMTRMFFGCSSLTELDLSGFDTSNVTDMARMFACCSGLTSLDLSGFDTSNVTDMNEMFSGISLASVDLSSFDTRNVTDMACMFTGCSGLTSLDLSSFDTSNVIYMSGMFAGCSSLTSLDLSSFDTSNVIYMTEMFQGCRRLTGLDLSSFDVKNVKDMSQMFASCESLTSVDLSSFGISNVQNMKEMFLNCSSLTSVDLSNFDTSNVENMEYMFSYCKNLTSVDLSSFDTSNVENMGFMFSNCKNLTSLDLSNFDTSNWYMQYDGGMAGMFSGCSNLTSLDLSSFEIMGVEMYFFDGCNSLATLYTPKVINGYIGLPAVYSDTAGNLTQELTESYANTVLTRKGTRLGFVDGTNKMVRWVYDADTKTTVVTGSGVRTVNIDYRNRSNQSFVQDTEYVIFEDCEIEGSLCYLFAGLGNLKSIDFSGFKVTNPRDYSEMFFGCSSLTELDLSGFDTGNVTSMSNMFDGCSSLTSLDLSGFDTGNVTGMESMFYGCVSLTSLDLSGFDTGNVTGMWSMFYGCSSLASLDLSSFDMRNVTGAGSMFSGCDKLDTINAPLNLMRSVHVPAVANTVWRVPDGTEVTELPQNLNQSIVLTRHRKTETPEVPETPEAPERPGIMEFRVTGAVGHSRYSDLYIAENSTQNILDTYFDPHYKKRYQTLFINDSDTDLANLIPTFESNGWKILGPEGELISGQTVQDFSKGGIIYGFGPTPSGGFPIMDWGYTVTFVKKESGPRLFVNGPAEREIFLTDYFQNQHDILIANVGDAQLTGIRAELLDAVNVKLDDSRPVESALAAFDRVPGQGQEAMDVMANFGKVRLVPDGKGEISGTLKITADGQEPVYITLTGYSDNPRITTTTAELNMDDVIRVKYVPYSYTVETNNKYEGNKVTFSVEQGQLAKGLQMYPATGEIYGVPLEAGEFPITVKATFSRPEFLPSYAQLTLIVKENTDGNVNVATDPGYDLVRRVEDIVLGTLDRGSQTMVSLGEYAEFQAVYLDGEKLAEGQDYDSEAGSTRVTLRSQTLTGKGVGSHTLGIEFRTQGTGALKRAAQNYTVADTGNDTGNGGSGNGGESGGNHSGGDAESGNGLQEVDVEVSETVTYIVQPGDSLWRIAFRFYGTGTLWTRIYQDNAAAIRDPNRIYAGQKLVIRLIDSNSAGIGAGGAKGRIYTVMLGDNLWTIARKVYGNGMLWEKIYQANRELIFDPRRIYAGQRIVIPQEE